MARNKGFMLIYPYFLFPNGFYKAYFRKFIVRLVTHVTKVISSVNNNGMSLKIEYLHIYEG